MIDINSFGVLGGDKRQIALAESIASDGYTVYVFGFDNVEFSRDIKKAGLEEITAHCENLILPLPVTTDGLNLNTPYCDEKIELNDRFAERMRGKQVYGGMIAKLIQTSEVWDSVDIYDYYNREEFTIHNAVPAAEGAIEIAMREYPGTVNGSKCLVVGYGRIGKVLAWMLRGIGASVTVSARKHSDIAWIESYGYHSIFTDNICDKDQYDVIFNTVPARIFNRRLLSKMHSKPLIIDLASQPGGVDYESAEDFGIKTVHALSLPGKVAPKTAGEIIKTTIYNIMEE
ncbi:dipicolinate synthase subunit DpsA [Caproiciproducens galactitolivorans]|uniref:Dipicolinate synthase subunit DpsA n=1 Tax=Caproiciproducens galactitolivorans TaxID=642589 RepID=A0ABT4BUA0_9FIRM|nr:dipicolinate synthase subunit DpsA [Caproiciproducens galactitolivorans]MCY1714470.1 dipicolinate synthase subunit DpsA [Caproiciproducens galactitolivorans]